MAVMTGLAAFAVLWPLARRHWPDLDDLADARSLYRAQLSDIQRDKSRGLIDDVQAQGAEAEAGRRLLRAGAEDVAGKAVDPAKALRRRRVTSVVALLGLPLVGLGVYGMHGVPGLPSLPLAARLSTNPANLDVNVAVARIEAHLALNPGDGRGWDVVAPVYFRLQRYEDAAKAYRAAIQHAGPSQERFAGLGDALTQGAQGMVTAQAREAFQQAVALDATDAKSRFYLAIAQEQEGKLSEAAQAYKALIADAPPAANWTPMVQERLARIEQPVPAGGEAIAALPAPEQSAMIRTMVENLSGRLGTTGGTLEEWSRLVQARTVLGERELAASALDAARRQFASDPVAIATLGELALRLGLPEKTP